jgi:hypothetical protein
MYQQTIPKVKFYGPTNFQPIIQKTVDFAAAAHQSVTHTGQVYYVLLIVTDGAITDMGKTTDAIVAASHLPISIIIIGVGDAVRCAFSGRNLHLEMRLVPMHACDQWHSSRVFTSLTG